MVDLLATLVIHRITQAKRIDYLLQQIQHTVITSLFDARIMDHLRQALNKFQFLIDVTLTT
jgi:hypothetical protein